MNEHVNRAAFASPGFGIGKWVTRPEDQRLLRGEGRFTDDISLAGQTWARILRSQHAHGIIRSIDTTAALAMPGVLGIFTGADLAAAGYRPLAFKVPLVGRDGGKLKHGIQQTTLATDRVRFVGDPIAIVVAETEAQAIEAADAIEVDIEPLPAVVGTADALAAGAPCVYDDVPDNVALDFLWGDEAATAAVFAGAAHVTRLDIVNTRVVINSLEPRAALADYDPESQRFTLHVGSQGAFGMRGYLAEILGVPVERVRVLTPSVGGSFGLKASVFPEYLCILHAARVLGRPVKWTNSRYDSFISDHHGRDADVHCELALDADGRFLAVRITGAGNIGAYVNHFGPVPVTGNVAKNLVGPYQTPVVEVATRVVFTNTVPIGPYRGAGRPEANYYMQRLIDTAAHEMGIDPVDLRRRNLIAPEQVPYATPAATTYDSGEFAAVLDHALDLADWHGFEVRRQESAARGMLRGRGIGQYLEVTAAASPEMGGIRFDAEGTVTIVTGTLDYGQGHAAAFAQVLVERLGVPFECVRLVQGDSDLLLAGGGTGGSRSIMASGTAIVNASTEVIARGRQVAAVMLEADIAAIEFADGLFRAAGTNRSISVMDMAKRLADGYPVPAGCPTSLTIAQVDKGVPATFPNGCHICEVEIEPETGVVAVVRYTGVDDFGTIVNPMIVEAQMHGGVTQGIGQCLMEQTVYGETGQLMTGSFMDYAMPRADDVPVFRFVSHPVPATTNALGVKGCGEAGCAGSMPSVMNAIVDALRPLGVRHLDMPATPERVWQAIRRARSAPAA